MSRTKAAVPIFINREKYEVPPGPMTGREILAVAGYAEGYDLILLQGEGDPSGGTVILADQVVEIKAGLHFRVLPGNRTFGGAAQAPPERLSRDVERLRRAIGCEVTLGAEGNQWLVTVKKAALPNGAYSKPYSDVLMIADFQYPMSAMDMFYMEVEVLPANGTIPQHAQALETHGGRQWRRWSWHRHGRWTPNVDSLLSHWTFIEDCWAKEAVT